jgi:hypothetical protein
LGNAQIDSIEPQLRKRPGDGSERYRGRPGDRASCKIRRDFDFEMLDVDFSVAGEFAAGFAAARGGKEQVFAASAEHLFHRAAQWA